MARPKDPDAQTLADMAEELQRLPPLDVTIQPQSALQLVAILQLVKRHPNLPENIRDFADGIQAKISQYFIENKAPTTLSVIRRGDNPDEDR